jgi:hypothetical protein
MTTKPSRTLYWKHYELMYREVSGPRAVVRQCQCCKHFELVRKGIPGVGRGYGMREGNKARGRIIQHFKTAHPAEYAAIYASALQGA